MQRPAAETRWPERETPAQGELTRRFVHRVRLGTKRTHRIVYIVLAVLCGVCVLAALVRLSALPLIPVAAFAVGAYGNHRARGAEGTRRLLGWSSLALGGLLVGFRLMSLMGSVLG